MSKRGKPEGTMEFQKLSIDDKCIVKGHESETLKYGKNVNERICWSCWKEQNRGKGLGDKKDSIEEELRNFEKDILSGFLVIPTFDTKTDKPWPMLAFHTALVDEFNISNTIKEKIASAHELGKKMNSDIKYIEDIEKEILVPLEEESEKVVDKRQLLATKLAYTQYLVSKIAINNSNLENKLDFEQDEAENKLLKKYYSGIVYNQMLIAQKNVELLIDSKSEKTKHAIRENILKQLKVNNGATKTLESENNFVKIYVTYIKFIIDENNKILPLIVGKTTITEAKREDDEVYSNIFGGKGRYGDFKFKAGQLKKNTREVIKNDNTIGKDCKWLNEYMLVNIFATEKEALDEEKRVFEALHNTNKYTIFQS